MRSLLRDNCQSGSVNSLNPSPSLPNPPRGGREAGSGVRSARFKPNCHFLLISCRFQKTGGIGEMGRTHPRKMARVACIPNYKPTL
ncbi:hypothetical protein [Coleofasciculus sp. FACHB-129]|uniref:hypothetical protein n=1 Tax=Coleofasciculus sp. FACHB-129 TaxID=2692785 RepID=UPI0019B8AC5F|nr:hypothetical protein [Coleofasciculus sp. FACHB-129]MBD2084156.1 hypothetical protein [Coleofasciculus sp. FACHB-542]